MSKLQQYSANGEAAYEDQLNALRHEIDQLDHELLKLLDKRCAVVEAVGALKHANGLEGTIIRPGREADMVRNVVEKLEGAMPPAAAAFMWRMIISGCINIEEKAHISAYAPPANRECYWLSREHFGSFTPASQCLSTMEVVKNVVNKTSTVGILPVKEEEKRQPWWSQLCTLENRPYVFCQLPFIRLAPSEKSEVFCIANITPEASSDDHSLWVAHLPEKIAQGEVEQHLIRQNITVLDSTRTLNTSPTRVELLLSLKGFLPDNAENQAALAALFAGVTPREGADNHFKFIGAYATSITL